MKPLRHFPTGMVAAEGLPEAKSATYVVSEVFGPTVQGEGPSLGRRCGFVRLGACNLHCTWCDTPYTWDWQRYNPRQELRQLPLEALVEHLKSMGVNMVVVSGGEPLLQDLGPLIVACRRHGWRVEVETNGTLIPQDKDNLPDQFNVSPKLSHAGDLAHRRIVPEALQWLNASQRAIFKFVVQEVSHLEEVQALVAAHGLAPVYIMPEGITAEAVCRISTMLAEEVIRRGWNLTTRLHVLLWGAERGK